MTTRDCALFGLAAAVALTGCDRHRERDPSAAEETPSEARGEPQRPPPPSEIAPAPSDDAAPEPSAEASAAPTPIREGPMRIVFPAGFPPPSRHVDEGLVRGFAIETTTYDAFAPQHGLVSASTSDIAPEAFETHSPHQMLAGVQETLLIEMGGKVVREDVHEVDGRLTREVDIATTLRGAAVQIRVKAHLEKAHLVQALFISASEQGLESDLAHAFFDSLELDISRAARSKRAADRGDAR